MLAIFDVDGTLCDSREIELRCLSKAIEDVLEVRLDHADWEDFGEATSSGITSAALASSLLPAALESAVESRFLELLREASVKFPEEFTPIAGAVDFLDALRSSGQFGVAIATGGWESEARFKLSCCGLDLRDFPHATSSDTAFRIDIVSLAARRAGVSLDSCVYFADAQWDILVSQELEIPLVGIGRRGDLFREEGQTPHFRDYRDGAAIMAHLQSLRCEPS